MQCNFDGCALLKGFMNLLTCLLKTKSPHRSKSSSGFTLIELLIVIIIIGILSAIALPAMLSQAAKARQAEAKTFIGSINRAQQGYMMERLEFADSIERLGILSNKESKYYSYSFVTSNIQGSVIARPLAPEGARAYSGATTLYLNDALLKTIICETKLTGTRGLAVPDWDGTELTLACPSTMDVITR